MARSIDLDTGYILERELRGGTPDAPDAAGIGVVMALEHDVPVIRRVLVDGPAARSGLKAGLEIRTIGGASTDGLAVAEVMARLKGPAGSTAILGVGLPGAPTREVSLPRALVINRADCRVIAGDMLYLRPGLFDRSTTSEVQAYGGANPFKRGVILDLRGNQGGLLDQAASVADLFLADGVIYGVRGLGMIGDTRRAKPADAPFENAPLIVLVDHDTGSGAEVVAAALQDAKRAVVIGEPTIGRAVVAALFPIPGFVLKVPVGELLRPSGDPIGPDGVKPDLPPPAGLPPGKRSDVACRGVASPSPVASDPLVALAVTQLLARP
jgi:carboxyl-terminal processing protease